jgi:uncharacterized damage-inducible protein DinB
MADSEINLLLRLIDQAYDRKAWHGPNLRGSVRGLDASTAAWRPQPGRHNIWEIVVHAAYWKYAIRRRLLQEKRGSFPLKGSNWFARPVAVTDEAWKADLLLLEQAHQTMRAAIAELKPADLRAKRKGSKFTTLDLIAGIAAHDVYHAGQIQLLKRLAAQAGGRAGFHVPDRVRKGS